MARRLLIWAAALAIAAAGGQASTASAAPNHGIELLASQRIDSRLVDLTVSTPALRAPTGVRVLLPAGYRRQKPRRYPVLYLLHGALQDYRSWTDDGDAGTTTAGRRLIVVMPDGGNGGCYTNWVNGGAGGPPMWETYHVNQLIPWIDARYRTIPTRAGRAIAGLSMGGLGAMSYSARHPKRFSWAASFSGGLDIVNFPRVQEVLALAAQADGGEFTDLFGDPVADQANWRAHNPWDLAERLRGTKLVIHTRDGRPGPFDPPTQPFDTGESLTHEMSVSFHERLLSLGIPHTWADLGPGSHSWPYWRRDLGEVLPSLMRTFAKARRAAAKAAKRKRHRAGRSPGGAGDRRAT